MKEILMLVLAAIVLVLILKLFKVRWKFIISLLLNVLLGGVALYLVNYIPGINLEINIVNSLLVGILGIPGVIILLILYFFE